MSAARRILMLLAASSRVNPGTRLSVRLEVDGADGEPSDEAPLHPKYVTEDWLHDPGFGFGPVKISALRTIDILGTSSSNPRLNDADRLAYRETYEFFADIVEKTKGVSISSDKITWRASDCEPA